MKRWLLGIFCVVSGSVFGADRPNVLLILVDDLGFSDLGCYGGEIATPNLDKLAAEGTRFTQFYNCAVCVTTRSAILTGLHPRQKGGPRLGKNKITLGEAMKAAGYETALTGKWHLGNSAPNRPIDRGFGDFYGLLDGCCNFFNPAKPDPVFYNGGRQRTFTHNGKPVTEFPEGYYTTDAFSEYTVGLIERFSKTEQPFFLHLCYTAPHFPMHAFEEDIAKYRGKYSEGYHALREARHRRQTEMGLFETPPKLSPEDPKSSDFRYDYDVPDWENLPEAEQKIEEARMEVYAAMVDRLDQGIGQVLDALQENGVEKNTVVMFLSDNGGCASWPTAKKEPGFRDYNEGIPVGDERGYEFCGKGWGWAQNAPFRQFKTWCHEGGIATPMIVRWPGVTEAGAITHQPGHIIDVMPTLLELAGSEYPAEISGKPILPVEGKSLLPIFRGETREPHDTLAWELYGNRAIRQRDWKAIWNQGTEKWELYNLKTDRTETENLASKHPDRLAAMARDWEKWEERVSANAVE
ncbi:MAG: arylsulfatase [Verrucomicrobiales bacterium]|nr:arylsulfatase [Verrucomicrobiales bacterium]